MLDKQSREWVKLCIENASMIDGLLNKFGKDGSVENYVLLREYVKPMSETDKDLLNQVREHFVNGISNHMIATSMTMSQARLYLINELFYQMYPNQVTQLKQFIHLWTQIDEIGDSDDLIMAQSAGDHVLMSKLHTFVIKNCKFFVKITGADGAAGAGDLGGVKGVSEAKGTDGSPRSENGNSDEEEFGTLVDRLGGCVFDRGSNARNNLVSTTQITSFYV